MDDLISRKALIETIKSMSITLGGEDVFPNHVKSSVLDAIEFSPTVDAEPVRHGEWEKIRGMAPPEFHGKNRCSICGNVALQYKWREELSPYCPECGAKMDGGADND